ncbi:MAG: alpha amylase C-terminal domain-containing protein, partial [Muribaculaceae bacterium]|nr:alpha amylase C-terminal domain-containing protein [Muribaculaceae bacterium]
YELVLDSDSEKFGGYGLIDEGVHHFTIPDPLYQPSGKGWLKMYLPARTVQVLRRVKPMPKKRVKKETSVKETPEKKAAATKKAVAPKKAGATKKAASSKKEGAARKTTASEKTAPAKKKLKK